MTTNSATPDNALNGAPRKRGRPPVPARSDYKSVQFCVTVPREIVEALTPQELRRLSLEARHQFNQFVSKAATAIIERRDNQ